MAWYNRKPDQSAEIATLTNLVNELQETIETNSAADVVRGPFSPRGAGQYDMADTNHNVYLDLGYPAKVDFFMLYHMYSRMGVAKKAVEWPVDVGFKTLPTIEASEAFLRDFEKVVKTTGFWQRMKGLDTRQRVGNYAGLFIRVKDDLKPSDPIKIVNGAPASIVSMTPLYQSQLKPTTYDNDELSDRFGLPTIYQLSTGDVGGRNEGVSASMPVHWTRVVIAAEGADNGGIFGVPVLEPGYNDLVDLRKINGGGAEGIYKNSAMKTVFNVSDAKASKLTTSILETLSEQFNKFIFSPFRRAFSAAGMDVNLLQTDLMDPKNFNQNSLNDFTASVSIAVSILVGNQTGTLAGDQDEIASLSMVQSRRLNWMTEMIMSVIDWMILNGILPNEKYEIEWDDLLAMSDEKKLGNAKTMSETNKNNAGITGGGLVYTQEQIAEAGGIEPDEIEEPDETLPEDEE